MRFLDRETLPPRFLRPVVALECAKLLKTGFQRLAQSYIYSIRSNQSTVQPVMFAVITGNMKIVSLKDFIFGFAGTLNVVSFRWL